MLLQAFLGITVDPVAVSSAFLPKHANALAGTVRIDRPEMPADLGHLPLRGLAVGDARIDIAFERVGQRVAATPLGTVPDSVEVLVRV